MRGPRKAAYSSIIVGALSACGPAPFDLISREGGPTVADLVVHIQCAIRDSVRKQKEQGIDVAWLKGYVGAANLTVDVVDVEGLNPSLSFIEPRVPVTTNLTLAVGGQLQGTQHRNFNYNFPILLDELTADTAPTKIKCSNPVDGHAQVAGAKEPVDGTGLRGDLGLLDVMNMGKTAIDNTRFTLDYSAISSMGVKYESFGSTIEFTILEGISGGPNWNLVHFKGPNGSPGLISVNRTAKDTLVISFAAPNPGTTPPPPPHGALLTGDQFKQLAQKEPAAAMLYQSLADFEARFTSQFVPSSSAAAYNAAQANNTRMILQNLFPQLSP